MNHIIYNNNWINTIKNSTQFWIIRQIIYYSFFISFKKIKKKENNKKNYKKNYKKQFCASIMKVSELKELKELNDKMIQSKGASKNN